MGKAISVIVEVIYVLQVTLESMVMPKTREGQRWVCVLSVVEIAEWIGFSLLKRHGRILLFTIWNCLSIDNDFATWKKFFF